LTYEPRKFITLPGTSIKLPERGKKETWKQYQLRVREYIELNRIVLPPKHYIVYRENDEDFRPEAPRDWAWYILVKPNEPYGSHD
jgi:hypothetical protein